MRKELSPYPPINFQVGDFIHQRPWTIARTIRDYPDDLNIKAVF